MFRSGNDGQPLRMPTGVVLDGWMLIGDGTRGWVRMPFLCQVTAKAAATCSTAHAFSCQLRFTIEVFSQLLVHKAPGVGFVNGAQLRELFGTLKRAWS